MTKKATLPTIAAMFLSISLVAVPVGTVLAEETTPTQAPAMPMMQGGKGGMMPGQPGGMGMMMSPEMMQQRQAMMMQRQAMMMQRQEMMQQHWTTMEGHLANIEALLRELVELNKAKK
jgi:hypothetical protein